MKKKHIKTILTGIFILLGIVQFVASIMEKKAHDVISRHKEKILQNYAGNMYAHDWEKITMPGIGSIKIPPTLQLETNDSDTTACIDQKNREELSRSDMMFLPRNREIDISLTITKGDFPVNIGFDPSLSYDQETFDYLKRNLSEVIESLSSYNNTMEIKNPSEISRILIGNRVAAHINYSLSLPLEGTSANISEYYIFTATSLYKLSISYTGELSGTWKKDLRNCILTFTIDYDQTTSYLRNQPLFFSPPITTYLQTTRI